MIRFDCKQRSPEWVDLHMGVPTASQFHRIIQPAKLKPSSAQNLYIAELLAEHFLREPQNETFSKLMERGVEYEDEARTWFEFEENQKVTQVGFCLTDDKRYGASPDGFTEDGAGVEIKCPNATNHIANLLGDSKKDYRAQIQGGIIVCGLDEWWRVSYNPAMTSRAELVAKDIKFRDAFLPIMDDFLGGLERGKEQLIALGFSEPDPVTNESVLKERSAA